MSELFELPNHLVKPFLSLGNESDLPARVFMWGQYISGIVTPLFVEDGTELFTVQDEMHQANFSTDSSFEEAVVWRDRFLAELFNKGIAIQGGVADRVRVEKQGDESYVVNDDSIGLLSRWCWINQRNSTEFPITHPYTTFMEVAKRISQQQSY